LIPVRLVLLVVLVVLGRSVVLVVLGRSVVLVLSGLLVVLVLSGLLVVLVLSGLLVVLVVVGHYHNDKPNITHHFLKHKNSCRSKDKFYFDIMLNLDHYLKLDIYKIFLYINLYK
jgi:hypothetical protein